MAAAYFEDVVQDRYGNAVNAATVTVQDPISGALLSLYSDSNITVPMSNPTTSDVNGFFSFYLGAPQLAKLVVTYRGTTQNRTVPVVSFSGTGGTGNGFRSRSVLVAASNASAAWKNGADFICTGTNDHTTINSAINSIAGGSICLSDGTFNLGGSISIPDADIELLGQGKATRLVMGASMNVSALIVNGPRTASVWGTHFQLVADLMIDGSAVPNSNTNAHGLEIYGAVLNGTFRRIWTGYCPGMGIYVHAGNPGERPAYNTFDKCSINNGNRDGIRLGDDPGSPAAGWAEHNEIRSCQISWHAFGSGIIASGDNNRITDNQIDVALYNVYLNGAKQNTVKGNTCDRPITSAIAMNTGGNHSITDNYIGDHVTYSGGNTTNTVNVGRGITQTGSSGGNVIKGNHLTNTSPAAWQYWAGEDAGCGNPAAGFWGQSIYIGNALGNQPATQFQGYAPIYQSNQGSIVSGGGEKAVSLVVSASNAPLSWLNASDYVCTGTADDVKINAAISALPSSIGGTVILSEGTFTVSNSISITRNNITLLGMGREATTLTCGSAFNNYIIKITGNNPTINMTAIRDLKIDCNGTNQTSGGGIWAQGSGWGDFRNLWVRTPYNEGIFLDWCTDNTTFGHHNRIDGCYFDGWAGPTAGTMMGVRVHKSDECWVVHSDFEHMGGNTSPDTAIYDDATGLTSYIDNAFVGGHYGIWTNSVDNPRYIRGNFFDGVGKSSINLQSDWSMVEGNHFFNTGSVTAGTYSDIDLGFGNQTIIGNVFYSSNTNGQLYSFINEQGAGSGGNLITGNSFRVRGTLSSGFAIRVQGSGDLIHGNKGMVSEASGTASIAAASSSVTVTHGLQGTPLRVILSPTVDPQQRYWVSAKGATTFTITLAAAAVTNPVVFDWRAIMFEGS